MKNWKFVLFMGWLCLAQPLYAQSQLQVFGKVLGENKIPLPGATVNVKNTPQNVVTDADGNFSIGAPANSTLVISYSGYQTLEMVVSGSDFANLTLELQPATAALSEVVVTGYTSQTRRQFTGSVSRVSLSQSSNR